MHFVSSFNHYWISLRFFVKLATTALHMIYLNLCKYTERRAFGFFENYLEVMRSGKSVCGPLPFSCFLFVSLFVFLFREFETIFFSYYFHFHHEGNYEFNNRNKKTINCIVLSLIAKVCYVILNCIFLKWCCI